MDGIVISSRDMRKGMGIGGWWLEWTYKHEPSGCAIVVQTRGHEPPQHKLRATVLPLLEMLVQEHYQTEGEG